jgi:hypothetical protein
MELSISPLKWMTLILGKNQFNMLFGSIGAIKLMKSKLDEVADSIKQTQVILIFRDNPLRFISRSNNLKTNFKLTSLKYSGLKLFSVSYRLAHFLTFFIGYFEHFFQFLEQTVKLLDGIFRLSGKMNSINLKKSQKFMFLLCISAPQYP